VEGRQIKPRCRQPGDFSSKNAAATRPAAGRFTRQGAFQATVPEACLNGTRLRCMRLQPFRGTVPSTERLELMTIDALTGVVAVSVVVALIYHLWPPPDDSNGPGGNAP
jgi:hypothetical protein